LPIAGGRAITSHSAPSGPPQAHPEPAAIWLVSAATNPQGGLPRPLSPGDRGRGDRFAEIAVAAGHRPVAGWFVAWLPTRAANGRRINRPLAAIERQLLQLAGRSGHVTARSPQARPPTPRGEGMAEALGPCAAPVSCHCHPRPPAGKLCSLGTARGSCGAQPGIRFCPVTAPDGCGSGSAPRLSPGGPQNRQAGAAEGTALQHHHPVTAPRGGRARLTEACAAWAAIVAIEAWSV